MIINKKVSCSLMIANLLATVLIVTIHYNSKASIGISEKLDWNYATQEAISNGLARIAVPFFAMISGYFLTKKISSLNEYFGMLRNKIGTLFLPYLITSLFIFIVVTTLKWRINHEPYQPITPYLLVEKIFLHPLSAQFWFLRDLMILTIISPLIMPSKKIYSNTLILIFGAFWLINYQPFPIFFGWYLLNIETLFFFCLGGWLFRNDHLLELLVNTNSKAKIITFAAWLALILLRVYLDPNLDIWYVKHYTPISLFLYKAAIAVGMVFLIQFSSFFSKSQLLIYLSGLTFFVYLFHLLPLSYFRLATEKFISPAYSFYINFPIALILVFFAAHVIANTIPFVFEIISGGRSPGKALNRAY